jgi:hypothetical protein
MSKKRIIIVVLVLIGALTLVGIASAATPRGITPDGTITSINPSGGPHGDGSIFVTNNKGTMEYYIHPLLTKYYSRSTCPANSFGELQVGHVVGVGIAGGTTNILQIVVVFPVNCPSAP